MNIQYDYNSIYITRLLELLTEEEKIANKNVLDEIIYTDFNLYLLYHTNTLEPDIKKYARNNFRYNYNADIKINNIKEYINRITRSDWHPYLLNIKRENINYVSSPNLSYARNSTNSENSIIYYYLDERNNRYVSIKESALTSSELKHHTAMLYLDNMLYQINKIVINQKTDDIADISFELTVHLL